MASGLTVWVSFRTRRLWMLRPAGFATRYSIPLANALLRLVVIRTRVAKVDKSWHPRITKRAVDLDA